MSSRKATRTNGNRIRSILGYGQYGQSQRYFREEERCEYAANLCRKFAIGQRCFLLETQTGNVLWDMISLLDNETVEFVCPSSLVLALKAEAKPVRSIQKAASKPLSFLIRITTLHMQPGHGHSIAPFLFRRMTKSGSVRSLPCRTSCD